jgi:hypothetical protein
MADSHDDDTTEVPLSERLLDVLVFAPAGIVVSVVEEFPVLAERGRQRLGVRVSSARAIGQFAVRAGQGEFRRRAEGLFHRPGPSAPERPAQSPTATTGSQGDGPTDMVKTIPGHDGVPAPAAPEPAPPSAPAVRTNIPDVASLSIPGFDTLSASQVVQRLDGLNRQELVSVRAYETSTRGRRTILSRVDQLLDERS